MPGVAMGAAAGDTREVVGSVEPGAGTAGLLSDPGAGAAAVEAAAGADCAGVDGADAAGAGLGWVACCAKVGDPIRNKPTATADKRTRRESGTFGNKNVLRTE